MKDNRIYNFLSQYNDGNAYHFLYSCYEEDFCTYAKNYFSLNSTHALDLLKEVVNHFLMTLFLDTQEALFDIDAQIFKLGKEKLFTLKKELHPNRIRLFRM